MTIDNNEKINVSMEESVGILAKNATGNKDNLVANNNKEIDVNGKKSVGMLSNKSVINNKKKILVNAEKATGMYGENGSEISNVNNAEIEITAAGKSGRNLCNWSKYNGYKQWKNYNKRRKRNWNVCKCSSGNNK